MTSAEPDTSPSTKTITEHELEQCERANATGRQPVVFVHRKPAVIGHARQLYETFAVPASGAPLFQAATANLNPWTEAKVDTRNPDRGPLLIISGEKDHTVPWAIANASYQ